MVTRKSVAAKTATQSPARGATKPARAASARPAPARGVTKADGKTAVAKAGGKTATAAKAGNVRKAAPQVAPKVARKDARKAEPKPAAKVPAKAPVRTPAKASASESVKAPTKTGVKTPRKVASKVASKTSRAAPAASGAPGAASGAGTTRRVIAKRDGETRIVTPEIERIEHDVVEEAVTGVVPLPVAPGATRPDFWDQACADLMRRDRILKKLIPQFGPAHLTGRGEPFVTLARSIVGQQISVKAAQSVWDRVVAVCPKLTPAQFMKAGHDALAGCGLSRRKAEYILDLATHFKSGALHVDAWASMDDEAVIAELTGIRGIGRWTAEMFLMFNLMRPDVLPLDDVGLINAISVNYFSGEPVTRSEAREVAANWEPWRSVATWYMWRSLEPVPVEY
ncbi:DNA-3-methyladenine glycosylase [Pandoraea morbifera]|uniref:DNA-3-methyladenine glycosylase II n=1 Tax=Pandoraea morbifera TaxID=2508300 RepID=A0A5E4YN96_9BURK|nr:endonuclease III domain-containing protein [Pandoraea morbifera]VVE50289.1 DNA-3-methyladenine glycosylase [Pandoraea morbifera]